MQSVEFHPFPVLTTDRLLLSQLGNKDEEAIFRLRSDKEIMKHIPRPLATSIIDATAIIQTINEGINNNSCITWGIFLKHEATLIGTIGFVRMNKEYYRAEIGYLLDKNYQGKGIMHEALGAVLNFGFNDLGLHSVEAVVSPENEASIKLLERNQFKREGYFRQNQFYNLQFHDSVYYSLLTTEHVTV